MATTYQDPQLRLGAGMAVVLFGLSLVSLGAAIIGLGMLERGRPAVRPDVPAAVGPRRPAPVGQAMRTVVCDPATGELWTLQVRTQGPELPAHLRDGAAGGNVWNYEYEVEILHPDDEEPPREVAGIDWRRPIAPIGHGIPIPDREADRHLVHVTPTAPVAPDGPPLRPERAEAHGAPRAFPNWFVPLYL